MDKNLQGWKDIVKKGLDYFGVSLVDLQMEQLAFHAAEMLKWNKKTNLTAITDPFDVAVKHVVDSAAVVNYASGSKKVLDIGTGGGFPGIPLKILAPSLDITLLEASRKKVSFLKHVIRTLKLENIHAIQARGESLSAEPEFAGQFDLVLCRAFSGLDVFVNMAVPYLKEDGMIIAMKGRETEHENTLLEKVDTRLSNGRRIQADNFKVERVKYQLPVIVSERILFIIHL